MFHCIRDIEQNSRFHRLFLEFPFPFCFSEVLPMYLLVLPSFSCNVSTDSCFVEKSESNYISVCCIVNKYSVYQ